MGATVVGLGSSLAVKRYSAFLAVDVGRTSYFNRKFMGVGDKTRMPIQILPQLEKEAGDTITYDLLMALRMQPIEGDKLLRGNEEDLKYYSDSVTIDQMRGGVNAGGKMTHKRTIHDLRADARARMSEWWARIFDELFFMYLSGRRGMNSDYTYPLTYPGFAGNPFVAPDSQHLMYGGAATSKATMVVGDVMDVKLVERLKTRATTMGGGTSGIPAIEPITIDGEEHHVLCMHPWQSYSLRTSAGTGGWIDIQKAAAAAEGKNNPIFKGGLGMINNVVLHEHKAVNIATDFGASSNVTSARALFLGSQAAVCAFGSAGTGLRFDWNEEMEDRGNQVVITSSTICGIKKTAFTIDGTSRDFGLISADTAIVDPG